MAIDEELDGQDVATYGLCLALAKERVPLPVLDRIADAFTGQETLNGLHGKVRQRVLLVPEGADHGDN